MNKLGMFCGILLILVGIATGIYFGLWWAFIGGIVQVLEALRPWPQFQAHAIAVGIFRVLLAGPIGWLAGAFITVPGFALLVASSEGHVTFRKRRR